MYWWWSVNIFFSCHKWNHRFVDNFAKMKMFWWNSLNELNWPEVSSSICSIWIIWIESFATLDTIVYLFVFFQPQYNQTVISDSSEQWAFYGCWHFLQQQPVLFSAFSENVLNGDRRAEVLHVTAETCNSDKQSRLPDNLFFHHTEIAEANLVNTSATNSQQIRNFNCGYCSTFVCVYFPCLPSLFTHTHTHWYGFNHKLHFYLKGGKTPHLPLKTDSRSTFIRHRRKKLDSSCFFHFCSIPAIKGLRLTFSPLKF